MSSTRGTGNPAIQRDLLLGARLAGVHGHRVLDASGTSVGRVAWLRYGLDDRRPDALMVRPDGWRGLWSRHERAVPFAAVRTVVGERREVHTDLESVGTHTHSSWRGLPHRGATP